MRVDLDQLKKAITWIEANSNDVVLNVFIENDSTSKLHLTCSDKYASSVEIILYADGTMLPKIKRTEVL